MSTRLTLQVLAALIVGAAGAYFLEPKALSDASSNIVSALSILNAAIFPTVVLSATVLKAGTLSMNLVERYRSALRTQISFFFGILLFSLFGILAIIVAQTAGWRFALPVPGTHTVFHFDGVYNFVIVLLLAFVVLRLPAFLRALMSLIDVHIDSVAQEVGQREQKQRDERRREFDALPSVSAHQRPPEPLPIA